MELTNVEWNLNEKKNYLIMKFKKFSYAFSSHNNNRTTTKKKNRIFNEVTR